MQTRLVDYIKEESLRGWNMNMQKKKAREDEMRDSAIFNTQFVNG